MQRKYAGEAKHTHTHTLLMKMGPHVVALTPDAFAFHLAATHEESWRVELRWRNVVFKHSSCALLLNAFVI